MRAELGLLTAFALGCSDDLRAPLDLDEIEEPSGDCLSVIHESLDLGIAVHEYVADAPNSPGGWALATLVDELDDTHLTIVRIPASPDEPPTDPIELGFPSLASVRVDMRAGATRGELWVLHESSSTWLRKLVPGEGYVIGNAMLANFPPEQAGGCPYAFERQLVVIEGRPFVLALPNCSDRPALELQLLELDPDTLMFTSSWLLGFDPCVDDPDCLSFPYKLGPIRGGQSSHFADAERVAVGFSQVRDFSAGVTSTDVSLLELRLDVGAPAARLVTFRQVWITPTNLGPVHLAQDPFSVQLHVRNGGSEQDAALLRFDAIGELYVQIKTPQLLPLGGRGRLVQLASESAMIDVRDGVLEGVALMDVASWPVWEPTTLYELDDLVGFEPAGVGQLLLRRSEAPPQVVRLRCVD